MKKTLCLKVPKKLGSKAILVIRNLSLLNHKLVIKREDDFVIIPLSKKPNRHELSMFRAELQKFEMTSDIFQQRNIKLKNIREVLINQLPPQLIKKLPRSMDMIGTVALVDIPPELENYKYLLGEAILKVNRGVNEVLAKVGAVVGKRRIRKFESIAGNGRTETVYKEYGCTYILDPTKVYFSPRLSKERWRITQKVSAGEVVIDMFAGVGPFSIQLAKKNKHGKVYAIDVNPDAIRFLSMNTSTNHVFNVFPILGDARDVIKSTLEGKADRVIMNLPESAIHFIDSACLSLKSQGGIIHYYGFEAEPNIFEKAEEKLCREVKRSGRFLKRVLDSRVIRSIAPHEWQIAIDFLIC